MRKILALVCALVCCYATDSAQVSLAIKVGKLIDVENGKVVSDQVILVEGERIRAVGTNLSIPAGAKVIDLRGATVLPGLIDAHSHLLTNSNPQLGGDENNLNLVVTQMNLGERALLGAAMGRSDLESGITTVRDLGNSGWNGDVALRDAINKGWVIGPRMVVSTRAIAPVGGQFSRVTPETRNIIEQEFAQVTGVDEARRAVRQAIFDGADCIKVIVDYGYALSLTLEELKTIVDEAHAHRFKVAAHAMFDWSIRLALEAGVDSIEHGLFVSDETLKLMAEKKVFLVPTEASWEMELEKGIGKSPHAEQLRSMIERTHKRLKRAFELGVPVANGTDEYYDFPGRSRGEGSVMRMVRSFRDAGIPPMEIIRATTLRGAELLGWQDRIGSIKEGKLADLIAVRDDPLTDITALEHVCFVLKGGTIIRDDFKR
jgi:imidazolonepropionase-like amidohydrolase